MKLQYLGTAAAEGIPAIFCQCEVCRTARRLGGKEIRTRSQAILDNKILIDLPADTYHHALTNGLELGSVRHVIVTHNHSDHFYANELSMYQTGFSHREERTPLHIYGSKQVGDAMAGIMINEQCKELPELAYHRLNNFDTFRIDDYEITALPANHDILAGPMCYVISHEGKTLFYAHDTGTLFPEVITYLKEHQIRFDFVSLDCTEACNHMNYEGHGSLERDIVFRQRLKDEGIADEKTVFCLNHFSHNGANVLYKDFKPLAEAEGFIISYDGMAVEI